MPRVSVIMPLYNAEKYVEKTIESILRQTYGDFEIVIIDDSSFDNSVNIVRNLQAKDDRIKLYSNEKNCGIAFTRNRAIELSEGEYLALIDDDDIAPEYRLMDEVQFLDAHLDYDIVGGHCRKIDAEGNTLAFDKFDMFLNPKYVKAYLLFSNALPNGAAMVRKSFIKANNIRYMDDMCGAEDYRFWVECSLKGKIGTIDKVMLYWRRYSESETNHNTSQKSVERQKAIADIQRYALQKTGFCLSEQEYQILLKVFQECGNVESLSEIESLYMALRSIALQARELRLENEAEVTAMCRKRFGEKIGQAKFLWCGDMRFMENAD